MTKVMIMMTVMMKIMMTMMMAMMMVMIDCFVVTVTYYFIWLTDLIIS